MKNKGISVMSALKHGPVSALVKEATALNSNKENDKITKIDL